MYIIKSDKPKLKKQLKIYILSNNEVWLRISLLIVSLLALLWFRSKMCLYVYVAQSDVKRQRIICKSVVSTRRVNS